MAELNFFYTLLWGPDISKRTIIYLKSHAGFLGVAHHSKIHRDKYLLKQNLLKFSEDSRLWTSCCSCNQISTEHDDGSWVMNVTSEPGSNQFICFFIFNCLYPTTIRQIHHFGKTLMPEEKPTGRQQVDNKANVANKNIFEGI